jgi:diaminopimelate epimerase
MSDLNHPALYSGTGNTFALVDARSARVDDAAAAARNVCKKYGVDGLLVMEASPKADIRMRIVNPDGSEAEMCGNGSRCAAYWANHEAGFPSSMTIETKAGLLRADVSGKTVKIRLTDPKDYRGPFPLEAAGQKFIAYFINTGVPHVIVPVDDAKAADLPAWGRAIRFHDSFKPAGTNASFIRFAGASRIEARTYERGVEAETQSCGTGSTAAALVAAVIKNFPSPVEVVTASGESLRIHFRRNGASFTDVHLEGPVRELKGQEKKI